MYIEVISKESWWVACYKEGRSRGGDVPTFPGAKAEGSTDEDVTRAFVLSWRRCGTSCLQVKV